MQNALKNDDADEPERILNNKKYAEKIQFEYGWIDLNITEKYCTDILTQKDFSFSQKEGVFQERLLNKANKRQQGVM
ncbi:MAG: hypothetical protein ACSNEK_09510 [Parachlamydiaceae bacterium]